MFISWSGDKSRTVADALHSWLPTVLAGSAQCFMSNQDIRRGDRGMDVIAGELQDRDFGVVVLTSENLQSPWINFEAGALGTSLGAGKVAPLLLDVTRADVVGPLAQFQSTLLTERDDVRQFIRDMALDAPDIPEASINALFDAKWPELEAVIKHAAGAASPTTTRTAESMLEELLERVRRIDRAAGTRAVQRNGPAWKNELSKSIYMALRRPEGSGKINIRHDDGLREGDVVRVDTGSMAVMYDEADLKQIADQWNVRIVLEPHEVVFTPYGRFRDPAATSTTTADTHDVEAENATS